MNVTFVEEDVVMADFAEKFEQVSQIANDRTWLCEVYREKATNKYIIEVMTTEGQKFYSFDRTARMGAVLSSLLKCELLPDNWLYGTSFEEEYNASDAFQIDIAPFMYKRTLP